MVLLKYFAEESKEEWSREAEVAKSLSFCDQPHARLLRYRWHSKGEKTEKKNVVFCLSAIARVIILLNLTFLALLIVRETPAPRPPGLSGEFTIGLVLKHC